MEKTVKGVGTVILNENNEILLMKRTAKPAIDKNVWSLPCGKVKEKETSEKAIIREVKEELGIMIDVENKIFEKDYPMEDSATLCITAFKSRIAKGNPEIKEPSRCEGLNYFPLDNLPKPISKIASDVIEKFKKKLIIFDYDGVIVDSFKSVKTAFNKISLKYKLPIEPSEKEFRERFNKNPISSIKANNQLIEDIKQELLQSEDIRLFGGIKDVIKELSENNILVIISSNHIDVMTLFLEQYNLRDCFREIIGIENPKNKAEIINDFKHKYPCSSVFYISDTVGDIREAAKAKIKIIAVTWGYHSKEELKKENPSFLVSKPIELLEIFKK